MTDIDEFFRSRVPHIGYEIPQNESRAVWAVGNLLYKLDSQVKDFSAALELYDLCEADRQNTPFSWPFFAAREGAMTILHFQETMRIISEQSLRLAPSLQAKVDHSILRQAKSLFRSFFPQARSIRDAVAHPEITGPAPAESRGIMIAHSLAGRRYVTDFMGKRLSYELSAKSLENLTTVKKRFFSGFDTVNALIRKEPSTPGSGESA